MRLCHTPGCGNDISGEDGRRKFCTPCLLEKRQYYNLVNKERNRKRRADKAIEEVKEMKGVPKPAEKVSLAEIRRRKEIQARYTRI